MYILYKPKVTVSLYFFSEHGFKLFENKVKEEHVFVSLKTKKLQLDFIYFHSGRKSNFGLNIACLWKQPVTNIAAVALWPDRLDRPI